MIVLLEIIVIIPPFGIEHFVYRFRLIFYMHKLYITRIHITYIR